MLSHVQYLRELLDTRTLKALVWTDTRDMVADGAAKGAVDRELLHLAMGGTSRVQHAMKVWQAKGNTKSLELAAASAHLALCDPRSRCSLGSLTLSPVPPLRLPWRRRPSPARPRRRRWGKRLASRPTVPRLRAAVRTR
eukprot:12978856-Alexandrium_andersonii.AAC.1